MLEKQTGYGKLVYLRFAGTSNTVLFTAEGLRLAPDALLFCKDCRTSAW